MCTVLAGSRVEEVELEEVEFLFFLPCTQKGTGRFFVVGRSGLSRTLSGSSESCVHPIN